MSKIIFIYNGIEYLILCQKNDKMSSVIDGFYNKSQIPRDSVYFVCKGDLLDNEITEDKIPFNEQNKKIILVYDLNNKNNDQIIKSNEIICKVCKENAKIGIDNYHIILFSCKNNHKSNDIKFNDFAQTQYINLSKIICDFCKSRNKGNSYKKQFYRCCSCKKNICLICRESHSQEHNLINYDQKNYICEEHGEFFHSYCYSCEKNLCTSCENIHKQHATESFGSMIKDKNVLFEENEKLRKDIEQINKIIYDIIMKLNKVRENLGIYYEIHKSIISNNNKLRNYEVLFNINEFSNNTIKKDLENIIIDNNLTNQFTNLMNIYQKMETEQKNLGKEDKILLFDPDEEKEESSFNILDHSEFNNNNNNLSSQNKNKNEENNILSKSENKIVVKKEEENEEALEKKRSATIEIVSELKNILLEEVINKVPLISELLDINELLKNYKEDSPELNIVKLITTKYTKFRQVRQNGNSFYTCFLYRLFEFISLNKDKTLYDKIFKKILDAKTLITKNGYDWDFLKDSYNLFKIEFNSCFEQSLISLKSSRQYLDELFKSDERMNYLNHFIHFCVAAYIKENKILYENYISDDFEKWILKVEEVGLECCQLEILACVNYFDIGVKIEYLYPSKLDVVKYPENKKGDEIFINMLFRPDHYDVLYK